MRGLLHNFDGKSNFWTIAGTLALLPAIKDLKEKDHSANKERTSKVMWAVAILSDMDDGNKLRHLPEDEKKQIIEADILKEYKQFSWDVYADVIKEYREAQLTSTQRALLMYKDKLIERSKFLAETKYTLDNAKDLDAIITNSDKIFRVIASLEKTVEEELKSGGELKGGRRKGLQEKGGF
jgi:hypothetical protein